MNIVELAIDAAEAAVVLGARALCAVAALTESTVQNGHVDDVYYDARRRHPSAAAQSTTEASPEAHAGQPLASVANLPSADDLHSAAFACRKYAEKALFESTRPYWTGIADRLDYTAAVIARQTEDAANE